MPAAALSMAAAPRPAPSDAGEAEESPAASPDQTDSCISSSLAGSALSSQQPAGSALLSPSLMTGLGHDVSAPVAATNRTSRHSFNDPANLSERERALISEASDRGPEAPTRSWKLPVAWSWQLVLEDLDLVHAEVEKASDMAPMTLSVLVVEDQPFQQQAIHTLLRVFSKRHPSVTFHVELVDTSQAAMELLQTRRDFHVVMIDVIMPDMRGDTLLPIVRRLLGDHVAVIMISTLGDMGLIQRCLFSGADFFLVKPLQLQSIRQIWQQCMAKIRLSSSSPGSCVPSSPPSPYMQGCACASPSASPSASPHRSSGSGSQGGYSQGGCNHGSCSAQWSATSASLPGRGDTDAASFRTSSSFGDASFTTASSCGTASSGQVRTHVVSR